jgi:hypothetical protein
LIAGYRYRFSDTSRQTSTSDHALNVGLAGRLLRGVKGSLRAGYQVRMPHGSPGGSGQFSS